MKTTFKRATALLLSLLMVFSVCSTALIVYAAEDAEEVVLKEGTTMADTGYYDYVAGENKFYYVAPAAGYMEVYVYKTQVKATANDSYVSATDTAFAEHGYKLYVNGQPVSGRQTHVYVRANERVEFTVVVPDTFAASRSRFRFQLDTSKVDYKLTYVSLGDSTTNGYGLTGYEFAQDASFDDLVARIRTAYPNYIGEDTFENPNGLLMETPGAYPALFRDYLAETNEINVNLIQLAVSAMRADDVLTLLTWGTEDQYLLDEYSGNKDNSKYVIHNFSQQAAELPFDWEYKINEGDNEYGFNKAELDSMGKLYQNSVEAADVISINLGSNNFSIYMWGCLGPMIMGMMGNGDSEAGYVPMMDDLLATLDNEELVVETKALYEEIKAMLMSKLAGYIPSEELAAGVANLADYGAYTFLSYCIAYTKILERINELNSDADIIIMPMVNFMKGFSVDVGTDTPLDMSEYIGYVLNAANAYVAGMAAVKDAGNFISNDVFYADHGGMVDMLMAEMVELEATGFEGAEVLHSRLITSLIGWVDTLSNGAFNLNSAGTVTREAVAAYKAGDYSYFNSNYSYMGYVGAYVGMEKALINASQKPAVDVNMFLDIVGGTFTEKVTAVFGEVGDAVGTAIPNAYYGDLALIKSLGTDVATILTGKENDEGVYVENATAQGMLYVMAYFMVADGVVCHPSEKGYKTIYNAMVNAYENEYTATDYTVDQVIYLITNYYDEAYAYAYDYAVESGYIAAAVGAIENAEAAVKNIAIPFPTGTTEAFVAQAYVLKAEIAETLAQAKAFILAADELDQETLDALLALLGSAAEDLNDMAALLNQAAADVNTLAIIPAINAAYNELVNNVIPTVKSMLEQAVIEGTKKFVELAKTALGDLADAAVKAAIKFAPELDAMLYDYFYNNPEEVIAFFAEYGYIIAELAEKYGDEALGVAAFILVTYGEDVAKFFMENYETIFEGIVAWADKYGERTIEMIQVYAEATGLCDAVRAEIAALEEKLADLKAQLDYQLKELEEKLGVQLEVLKAQLESLKRELLIAAEPYKQAILAEIAKVEALIAEIEAKIEQVKALIAEIEAKIIEIQNQIAELNARLQNLIYAIQNLDEALKYLAYAGLEAATPMIQQALNGVAYAVSQLVGFVSEEAAKALDALIEQAKAFLDEAFYNATHADYAIDNTSSHVALGDNTMTAQLFGQYVQAVVDGADVYYTYKTTDLTSAGSKISALPVVLAENLETIVAADLITIGYGYDALAEETVNLLFDLILLGTAKVDYNIDLVAKVGPEAAAEIEKIVANVYATLIQNNLGITLNKGGIPVADAVVIAMKYFAYYAAEYAVYMPQAVYAIHEINPEALIMINAISNPIAGASIAVALPEMGLDVEIAFGDYLNYVCDAIYLETAVLAAINEKVVFVPATGIETTFTNKTVSFNGLSDLVDLLMNYETVMAEMFNIETTVNGNVAVVNKMADALNITVEHSALLGDVNGDGVVSITDAVLVLRFDAQLPDVVIDLSVADVDGDGMINITDAVWILRYDALLVDKLPASK